MSGETIAHSAAPSKDMYDILVLAMPQKLVWVGRVP
jgi:hypothetical protein